MGNIYIEGGARLGLGSQELTIDDSSGATRYQTNKDGSHALDKDGDPKLETVPSDWLTNRYKGLHVGLEPTLSFQFGESRFHGLAGFLYDANNNAGDAKKTDYPELLIEDLDMFTGSTAQNQGTKGSNPQTNRDVHPQDDKNILMNGRTRQAIFRLGGEYLFDNSHAIRLLGGVGFASHNFSNGQSPFWTDGKLPLNNPLNPKTSLNGLHGVTKASDGVAWQVEAAWTKYNVKGSNLFFRSGLALSKNSGLSVTDGPRNWEDAMSTSGFNVFAGIGFRAKVKGNRSESTASKPAATQSRATSTGFDTASAKAAANAAYDKQAYNAEQTNDALDIRSWHVYEKDAAGECSDGQPIPNYDQGCVNAKLVNGATDPSGFLGYKKGSE